jgi:glutamate synthase domain-containing protein 2
MADDFNFKINPADYLGSDYEAFKTDMLELAISKPSDYFNLRKTILKRVKTQAVQDQYNIYYSLLTSGLSYNSISIGGTEVVPKGANIAGVAAFEPKMPKQLVNEFALKAAKTIEAIADEAVEMLLPMNYRKIAEGREISKTASNLGFD